MKKNFIISMMAILPFLSSCDMLELKPQDFYSIDNYWENQQQVDRFMIGLHGRVRGRKHVFIQMGELRGGYFETAAQSTIGQGKSDLDIVSNTLSIANTGITGFGNFYMDIMQINHAIEQITDKVDFLTESDKNDYLGMLHGLRSFYYFHAFRTWGGLPLVDEAEVLDKYDDISYLNKVRSTERETYAFIQADIDASLAFYETSLFALNSDFKTSFWSKQASYMLKAEINLWGAKVTPINEAQVFSTTPVADLTEAQNCLLAIKNQTDLVSSFETLYQTKDNSEIIFSIRFALNEATNGFNNFLYSTSTFTDWYEYDRVTPYSSDPLTATSGFMRYEYKMELFNTFEANDLRRDFNFFYFCREELGAGRPPVVISFTEAICMTKYLGNTFTDEDKTNRAYVDDYPIYRKADLLLMLAEIDNELDGSSVKTYIETVRKRAYGGTLPVSQEFTYTNKEAAEEAILLERDKEFVCEGKRWYDVRRMLGGKYALDLCSDNELRLLWPIDPSDMSRNPLLEQNEAYK